MNTIPVIVRKAVSLALQGDKQMIGLLVKLGYDPIPQPFKFGNVAAETTGDLMKFSATVIENLGAGKISPQYAKDTHEVIDDRRKLIVVHEFDKRLGGLEEKHEEREEEKQAEPQAEEQDGAPPEDKAA